jgi:hypothetical protein
MFGVSHSFGGSSPDTEKARERASPIGPTAAPGVNAGPEPLRGKPRERGL